MAKPRRRKNQSRSKGSGNNGSTNRSVREDRKQQTSSKPYYFSSWKLDTRTVCALAAFFLYVNAVWMCGFCYDDYAAIQTNRDVLHERVGGSFPMSPWWDVWRHDFWGTGITHSGSHKSYRPLVIFSYRFDANLLSREPWAFHLTNALLYAVVCWMAVDFMLTPAVGNSGSNTAVRDSHKWRKNERSNTIGSEVLLLSGLWFTSHPIHTEAVASLVGRAEILAALFCMVGARLYSGCKEHDGGWIRMLAAMMSFFAACLCKEPAVVIPAVLAGVDIVAVLLSPKNESGKTISLGRSACLAAVSVGYVVFRAWLFSGSSTGQTSKERSVSINFLHHLGPMDRLRTAIFIQAKYAQLLVWPGSLSFDYSLGVIDPVQSWASPEMAFAAIVAGAVAAWVWYGLARLRRLGDTTLLVALGWTFGPLIPASHIVDIGTVLAERLLFLPSIGAVMLLCFIGMRLTESANGAWRIASVALPGCVCLFAIQTIHRNTDWVSTDSLNAADLAKHPQSLKLLLHCAARQVPEDKAFQCAKDAQQVFDRHSTALTKGPYNDGLRWMADIKTRTATWPQGADLNEALLYANQVIEMGNRFGRDDWSFIHQRKGTALLELGQATGDQKTLEEAAAAFQVAIEHDDHKSGHLYCSLATSNAIRDKTEEAYQQFQKCFEVKRAGQKMVQGTHHVDYLDYRNYAILMQTLSGLNSKDAEAARKWGKEAISVIETLMAWPNEVGDGKNMPESELILWARVRDGIMQLASDEESLED